MKNRVNLYTEMAFNALMELGLINTCKCKNNECYELKKGFNGNDIENAVDYCIRGNGDLDFNLIREEILNIIDNIKNLPDCHNRHN